MTKEILAEIISEKAYYYLPLCGLVFFFVWLTMTKLSLILINKEVKCLRLLPLVILGTIHATFGKIFVQQKYFGFISLLILVIGIRIIAKVQFIKVFVPVVVVFFLTFLGLIIVGPFIYFNRDLNFHFLQTPLGIVIGALIELVPLLIFISAVKYYNFFSIKKVKKYEIFGMLLFVILFFVLCSLMMSQYIFFVVDAPKHSFLSFFFLQLFLVLAALLVFIFKHQASKSEEEKRLREHLQQQLELCSTLVESLSGEQREFKNQLQVLKSMVELGKKEKFNRFIDYITAQMFDTTMIDFDNPILASALLEEIIQGRELGIGIKVEADLSLKDLNESFEIGRALKLVINYFLNNRAMRRKGIKEVTVLIEKVESYYQFTVFYGNNNLVSVRAVAVTKGEDQNLQKVEAIIKELCGKFSYGYSGPDLTEISFMIPAAITELT